MSVVCLSWWDLLSFVGVLRHLTCPFLPHLFCLDQREIMGLLDYRAMPSLRNVVHDGVLCTFSNRWDPGASGVVRQGRRHGPSIAYKITPCWITLLQPARRAAVLGQLSGLRPIGHIYTVRRKIIYFRYSSGLPGLNCSAYLLTYFFSLWFVQQGSYQKYN